MAENLLNGGQRDAFLQRHRGERLPQHVRRVTFWEVRTRLATRLTTFCTGRGPMNRRSFRAKHEVVQELAEIRIETSGRFGGVSWIEPFRGDTQKTPEST